MKKQTLGLIAILAWGCACVMAQPVEALLFDTITGNTSTNSWNSFRDPQVSPPLGGLVGVEINTNCPFELSRIEFLAKFDDPLIISNTSITAAFYRGTNEFSKSMLLEPAYQSGGTSADNPSVTVTPYDTDRWLVSIQLGRFGWGRSRIVSLRSMPEMDPFFSKMSLVTSATEVPGVVTYQADTGLSLARLAGTPAMRVWRRMVPAELTAPYSQITLDELELNVPAGYQLGLATNLSGPWEWQSGEEQIRKLAVSTTVSPSGFFKTRVDTLP